MTSDGYILTTLKNNTAILYFPNDGVASLLRLPPGTQYMRAFSQFTIPPDRMATNNCGLSTGLTILSRKSKTAICIAQGCVVSVDSRSRVARTVSPTTHIV